MSVQTEIISTHAPAGGATGGVVDGYVLASISTHAPAGGATGSGAAELLSTEISTHAPAGGATSAAGKEIPTIGTISTHAPAGGATRAGPDLRGGCIDFYSRPCGRGDLDYWNMARREGLDFYSRPCGRGDCIPYIRYTSWFPISTHAPAGGAT